jgi:hypothetical protein
MSWLSSSAVSVLERLAAWLSRPLVVPLQVRRNFGEPQTETLINYEVVLPPVESP